MRGWGRTLLALALLVGAGGAVAGTLDGVVELFADGRPLRAEAARGVVG
jgi:hypothetical protein